jgi:thimet oligopeptidase
MNHLIRGAFAAMLLSGTALSASPSEQADSFLKDTVVVPASPAAITARCEATTALVSKLRSELEGRTGPATVAGDLEAFDALTGLLGDAASDIYLVSQTHPDKPTRDSAEACVEKLSALDTAIDLSRPIYARLAAIPASDIDPGTAFILNEALTDYRLAGVDRDDATRAKVEALQNEITQIGLTFSRNIRERKGELILNSVDDLKGLPQDYIDAHKPGPDGKIRIGTDYPDVIPIFDFAEKEATRQAMYMVYQNRAWPANEDVLKTLLAKRQELAKLLGFPTYAALVTKDKMIGSPERVSTFIDEVNVAAAEAARGDLAQLLARQKQITPSAERVMPWSSAYLQNLLRKEKYDVDSAVVRTYFTYDKAKTGIFALMRDLFGADIRPWDTAVWHPSVSAYELYDKGTLIGRFYLDMHPRDGKYSHAAQFDIRTGIKDRRVTVAALVCNFPATGPMDHEDVETFLHEFGHLIHNLYSGRQSYALQSMNGLPRDFVEAPSQLLEEWVWDYDTLKTFATNEKGEPIPAGLVTKMNSARRFGEAMRWKTQLAYSAASLNYYSQPAETIDLSNLWKQQISAYSTMPYVEGTHPYAAFGHLDGYSAVYYTYVWSKAIALDLFTRFKDGGIRNPDVAMRYRQMVLEPGGTANPNAYIENFLGRPLSTEAFKNSLTAPQP